ncbi:MBL fold hydrolase [Bacteroidia bacterium]|nr:MBL fold hydrolase [Bacteroidia bacterium]
MELKIFVNNSWKENTLILSDDTKEAIVVDCGCHGEEEKDEFKTYIAANNLKLVACLNTHLHIDHIFGNNFIKDTYNLETQASKDDEFLFDFAKKYKEYPPAIGKYLHDGDTVRFGETELKVIAVPGHSPGGLCYYAEKSKLLLTGDVLFEGCVGRSDLPGSDGEALLQGIRENLFVLPDDVVVVPGHGPSTTIGREKRENPFFN